MGERIKKATIDNVAFDVLGGFAIILIIAGFLVPPIGQLDPSILQAVGWIFAFAALWVVKYGLETGKDAIIRHGDTTVTIKDVEADGDNS